MGDDYHGEIFGMRGIRQRSDSGHVDDVLTDAAWC